MSLETDLRTYLLADSSISNLVGTRVYALILPQNPTYPAITYQKISGLRLHDLSGPTGRAHPRISFSCWAESYVAAKNLAEKVRQRLDGFQGTAGSTNVGATRLENETDFFEQLADDPGIYRVMFDFFVSHTET